ncbi:MAG: ABC transporter substrate-binding protein [Candidatus Dormibacteria bacterium]
MSIPKRLSTLSMGAIVAVTIVACGTSSNTQVGSPIKIGVEGPMTGQYADVGAGFWQGAQAAAREINAQGGILGGRKLELVQADDVSDPADAVPAIRKLIDIDHIAALDGPNSTVLPAISPILVQNKIPTMFQGGTVHFDSNTVEWLWRPSPSDSQLGVAMATYALTKGYKKAALVFASVASAQTLKGVVKGTYTKNGGTITADVTIATGQTSYRSEVETVVQSKPDVILLQIDPPTAGPLFSNFKQVNNLAIPFIGSDLTAGSDFVTAVTPAIASQVLVSIQGSTSAGPGAAPFGKYYSEMYPGQPVSGANYSYDAIMELALAMQKAGSTDAAKLNAAIPAVCNPGGTDVSDWSTATAALSQGKKIHFVGAGGPAGYNDNHNALGAFSAFQSNSSGQLQVVSDISVDSMAKASAGTLGS